MNFLRGKGRSKAGSVEESNGVPEVLILNVGGQTFTTSKATLLKEASSRFARMFAEGGSLPPRDGEGRFFIDRDPKHFGTILNFLRDEDTELPKADSKEFTALAREAEYFELDALRSALKKQERKSRRQLAESASQPAPAPAEVASESAADKRALLEARTIELERQLDEGEREGTLDERTRDLLALELRKLQLERDRFMLKEKEKGRDFRYNLLIVGVTGTGKSSTLNTILDSDACQVSGAQAQGTRGCVLRDASLDPDHFVSYIDTQGLGADTSITDTELLSQIMMSTESILKLGIINNILISFDVNARTTPAMMANQLTLMELFKELRRSCFLVFTKWNTSSVQAEWNKPLRDWVRKWKKATSEEEIEEAPPSYEEMYKAFCRYVIEALANEMDGGAFSKMGTFLAFFEARVLFSYNLDAIQIEDRNGGELEPHIAYLYNYYRNKAMDTLDRGSTKIVTDDLSFLKEDQTTMRKVAADLIKARDEKIFQLEEVGRETRKRKEMKKIFNDMASDTTQRIKQNDYNSDKSYTSKIAALAGFVKTVSSTGCIIS